MGNRFFNLQITVSCSFCNAVLLDGVVHELKEIDDSLRSINESKLRFYTYCAYDPSVGEMCYHYDEYYCCVNCMVDMCNELKKSESIDIGAFKKRIESEVVACPRKFKPKTNDYKYNVGDVIYKKTDNTKWTIYKIEKTPDIYYIKHNDKPVSGGFDTIRSDELDNNSFYQTKEEYKQYLLSELDKINETPK